MNYMNAHGEQGLQQIIAQLGRGTPYEEVLAVVLAEYTEVRR